MRPSTISTLFALAMALVLPASAAPAGLSNDLDARADASGTVRFARIAEAKQKRSMRPVKRAGAPPPKGKGKGKGGNPPAKGQKAAAAAPPKKAGAAATPPAKAPAAAKPPAAAPPPPAADADPQKSLTLLDSVINKNFTDDGQNPVVAGQTASSTSTNNYINFCALTLPGTPLTNGAQVSTGSCNQTPMGLIPSTEHMPAAKFNFPRNMDVINANVPFNASLNIANFQTGVFTNAQKTYFAAPQTLNAEGQIIGHTHIVIETLTAMDQIIPTDPKKFFFFKGVDGPANEFGEALALVTAGVPAGVYRACSINTSANHAPVVGPIAQHGSFDDCSYFTAK